MLRLIAVMGMGTGALAVIGGTVVIIGFLTLSTGALIAVQGYNTLSNVGIEALTGFLGAFLNVRFIAPATAGVALAATIGAGATAQLGAMRINEEIDALEVMGIRAITYLASTRIVAGVIAVIPIYTVAVLMSFLATRFGTTVIYGQSRGVYDHYFSTFLQPDRPVVVLHRGAGDGGRRDGGAHLLRVHRDRRTGRRWRGGRPGGPHLDHRRCFHPVDNHAVRVRPVRQLPPVGVTVKDNAPRRGKIDPIWWAPVLFLIVAALITLTALLFSGTLRTFVPLTLVSDRAGLVMENGAKVKLRGVQIGEVGIHRHRIRA